MRTVVEKDLDDQGQDAAAAVAVRGLVLIGVSDGKKAGERYLRCCCKRLVVGREVGLGTGFDDLVRSKHRKGRNWYRRASELRD